MQARIVIMDIEIGQVRRRRPAKQARSRQTRERLIAAGSALFSAREFEDITISELAAAAGCSVGAFYHHFNDKEDYYDAVVAAQLAKLWADAEARFEPVALEGLPSREVIARAVRFIRDIMRDNQSLLRISYHRSLSNPEAWAPIRTFGKDYEERLEGLLATACGLSGDGEWRASFAFGMQMLYATLLHSILRRPGPVQIEDEAMVAGLTAMLTGQLER